MPASADPRAEYRSIIDALVEACRNGQGRIGYERALAGVWNRNADEAPEDLPDQYAINRLLEKLEPGDREVLAGLLQDRFVSGVHAALVVLHEHALAPFDDGYEGTPFHDFIGRLDNWPWPVDSD